MINRQDLLNALKLVEPALAAKDIIVEFTHVWFDGRTITATNDMGLGIRVPWTSTIKGGLPGKLLLGLLSNSKAKEVDIVPNDKDDDGVILKMGKASVKLTLLPLKAITGIYKKQERGWLVDNDEPEGKKFETSKAFLDAISLVMISAEAPKSKIAELTGVTVIKNEGLHAFATDDDTVAWCKFKDNAWPLKEGKRVTIPIPFVEQLLGFTKNDPADLWLGKNFIYANCRDAGIFSNLVTVEEPTNLIKLGKGAVENAAYVPIPARLKLALARSFSMLDNQKESFINLRVKESVLRITTKTALGELKDSIPLEGKMPEVETMLDPKLIKRGLPMCERMYISKTSTVLTSKEDFVYIIAAFSL